MRPLNKIWTYKNIYGKAKMGSRPKPILIVEGIDDVKKINLIKQSKELSHKKIEVKSIGSFAVLENKEDEEKFKLAKEEESSLKDFYGKTGATHVMNFIEKVKSHVGIDNCKGYVLGIVDRDALCLKRKEIKENDLLYVLDYYSLENYYINKEVIEKTLSKLITNPNLTTDSMVSSMYNEVLNHSIENLYYISLEALKKSCDNNYDAITGYKPNNVDNFLQDNRLIDKRNDLDIFAQNKNYKKNIETALKIIKGKWFISSFCKVYLKKIKELEQLCKNKEINQCDNCSIDEISEPCLYKPRKNKLNSNDLEEKIYELIDLDSLTPIKERIKQLK